MGLATVGGICTKDYGCVIGEIGVTNPQVCSHFNPLVPRVQKIKIRALTLNRLSIVEFVKKMVYLGAHYRGPQGLMC